MPVETGLQCPALIGERRSGLSREHTHGKLHPMDDDAPTVWQFVGQVGLVCLVLALGTIAAAALP